MARPKNQEAYDTARLKLLEVGEQLFRQQSYADTGISDVLKKAGVAKGSFYHYFKSKEEFGLAVVRRYSNNQVEFAHEILKNSTTPATERLKAFFHAASLEMARRKYAEGCLMCNLTTELADFYPAFQDELKENWKALSSEITMCLKEMDLAEIRLAHLTSEEAADWLLNAWSGALSRMKATRDETPLKLFIKSVFSK